MAEIIIMRNLFALMFLLIVVFISGCVEIESGRPSNVGLSLTLTSDIKKVNKGMPTTFILTVKNLASEPAQDISVHLTNLTDWEIENNKVQKLENLPPQDLYKFSWVAYAPQQNKIFIPTSNIFYYMKTKLNVKLRIYDNDYLDTLKQEERTKIKEKPALLSSIVSKKTPVAVQVNLKQPFILTRYRETFPFVLDIKNVGLGEAYSDLSIYPPSERNKDYFRFEFSGNATLQCDFESGDLVKLSNKSKSIVCRIIVTKDDLNNYADFSIDFTISYTYLDKATTKIEVI